MPLKPGDHTLTMTYREDGALLDKIALTPYPFGPAALEAKEAAARRSFKEAVGARFKTGVGVSHRVIQDATNAELINKHFQILTPEDCTQTSDLRQDMFRLLSHW